MNPGRGQSPHPSRNERLWYKLVRFGFRLLYNELAFTYDPISWLVSLGNWRDWQRTALPFIEGPQVLELAHGPGHMLLELEQAGYQVIGLDLSPNMGRMAAKKIFREKSGVSLVRGAAQDIPFASDSFSSVMATFPSEFILESETVAAVRRVLRPEGRFIVVVGAQITAKGAVSSLIKWLYTITGQRSESAEFSEHSEIWNRVRERLSSMGFDLHIEQIPTDGSLVTMLVCQRTQ